MLNRKSKIPWIISVILAVFIVYGFMPDYGGVALARILVMIILSVIFKAVIEFFLNKYRNEEADKQNDNLTS